MAPWSWTYSLQICAQQISDLYKPVCGILLQQPKWTKTFLFYFKPEMFPKFHRSLICSDPKLKTTKIPINEQMDQQIVGHPQNGLLLGNEKQWATDLTSQRNLKAMMLSERRPPHQKKYTALFPFVWNSRKCKFIYSDRKQIRVCLYLMFAI